MRRSIVMPELAPLDGPGPLPVEADARAARARRKLARASRVARLDWVGLAIAAAISGALELSEPTFPLTALVLGALAWNERRGRERLLAADPRAPRLLALNQVLLLLAVVLYCVRQASEVRAGPGPLDAALQAQPGLAEALGADDPDTLRELGEQARQLALFVYGAVAVASALLQGALALYYWSLRGALDALVGSGTPNDGTRDGGLPVRDTPSGGARGSSERRRNP